jgi:hypothetical protein
LIIFAPLLWVGEYFVGFVDLLEALLGLGVVWVYVGVVLPGQATECLLDLLFIGLFVHAQDLVIVLIVHLPLHPYTATMTLAGRSKRPSRRYPGSRTWIAVPVGRPLP